MAVHTGPGSSPNKSASNIHRYCVLADVGFTRRTHQIRIDAEMYLAPNTRKNVKIMIFCDAGERERRVQTLGGETLGIRS